MQSNIIFYLTVVISLVLIALMLSLILLQRQQQIRSRKLEKLQQEGILCKDLVLDEYARMRHDYNNMLQTLTNLIEEEDITALKEYQPILHEQAQYFHKNSILQFEKVRNLFILNALYQLSLEAAKSGYMLNIMITGKIEQHYPYEDELHPLFAECMNSVYSSKSDAELKITLGLRESQEGLYISFVSKQEPCLKNFKFDALTSLPPHIRKIFIYNTFIKDNCFIQEILIPL